MAERLLRIRVSLKGRPVRAFAFSKDSITVGRDPGSDVFLDNPGVSREHCRIALHPSGSYAMEDLDSANGVFVNDQQVKIHFIRNNDVVHVGKFALWFTYDEDRRGEQADARRLASTQDEGTTVLRTTELQEMIESLREAETATAASPAGTAGAASMAIATSVASSGWTRRTRSLVVLAVLIAFAGGYVAGGGLSWVPWHRALDKFHGAVSSLPH
jgi:FHA domain-containing protein